MILKAKPQLMAVLNVTPDSFSDGGDYLAIDTALKRVETMVQEGADIIDLGGESTRPGAVVVSEQEEMDRVLPVFQAIKQRFDIAVSVDTSNATLMQEVIAGGVDMINDVRALARLTSIDFLAQATCKICLMHMQGSPQTMQNAPRYHNVNPEVIGFLADRLQFCQSAGVEANRLIIDPGFGFGKTLEHNLSMLNRLEEFNVLNCPILVGTSRKSMIGQVLNKDTKDRLFGSLATVVMAVQKGVAYVRVHDVAATRDAIDMTWVVITEGIEREQS